MAKELSAIRKALEKATGISQNKGEDAQSYMTRLVRKVAALDEDEWDKLDEEAQGWYNKAAELMNKKKDIEPSLVADEEEEAPAARKSSRAKVDDDEGAGEAEPKEGDTVLVKLTNGEKVQGEITEIDEKNIVLDVDGEEEVYRRTKVESITVKKAAGKAKAKAEEEEAPPAEPKAGDKVRVTLKDGEQVEGELIEIDEKNIVLGEDEDVYRRSKIEKIEVIGGKKAKAKADDGDDEKPAARKGKGDDKPAAKTTKAKDDEGKAKPATVRIREIICEDPDRTKEQVQKILDKEGVEVKGTTLDITFSEVARTVTLLKQYGHLK